MDITQELIDRLNDNPLYNSLGIRVGEASDGVATALLEPQPECCWPFPGQPHGGVLFTLMDSTMAWAVFSQLEPGFNCATVNLDIQYTHPAKGGLYACSATVTHRTGRFSFTRSEIYDKKDRLLAMGQGTFRVVKMDISAAAL